MALVLLAFARPSVAAEVVKPRAWINDHNIFSSASLKADQKFRGELERGISKEVVFYIDLFRVWDNWPDEFVAGKTITRTLRCDPIKKEYLGTSFDGSTLLEKRFSGCGALADWALNVGDMKIAGERELEPSRYFVRVSAESLLRKLPPVIGTIFFFLPSKEFVLRSDSDIFNAGTAVVPVPGGKR